MKASLTQLLRAPLHSRAFLPFSLPVVANSASGSIPLTFKSESSPTGGEKGESNTISQYREEK